MSIPNESPQNQEVTPEQEREFVATELEKYRPNQKNYPQAFLAYYQKTHSTDFGELKTLLGKGQCSERLELAIDELDQSLDQYFEDRKVAIEDVKKVRETYEVEIKPFYEMDLEIPVSELVPLALKVVPNYRNTAMHVMAEKLQQLNKEFEALPSYTDKSILDSYEEQMRKQCAGIFMIKDSIDSRLAREQEEKRAPIVASTSTPIETEKPAPKTEAEFVAMLHENGNRAKYMTEVKVGDDTEVTLHLPTKNDVEFSRIQHFVGDDKSMMGLGDISKYQVLSGGNTYEWKDGTWKDLSKPSEPRLLVYDGTTYKIHKKEEARVATADAPIEPVPSPEPIPTPPVVAEVKAPAVDFMDEGELKSTALTLKNNREVLTKVLPRQRAELVAKKGKLFTNDNKIDADIAKVDKEIDTYSRSVTTLIEDLTEQKDNPTYAVVMNEVFDKDTRTALKLPEPTSSVVADGPADVDPEVAEPMAGDLPPTSNVG